MRRIILGKTVTKSMFKNGGKDYDKDGLNNNKELVLTDVYDSNSKPFYRKQGWVMLSNPVKWDTDGNGYPDGQNYPIPRIVSREESGLSSIKPMYKCGNCGYTGDSIYEGGIAVGVLQKELL